MSRTFATAFLLLTLGAPSHAQITAIGTADEQLLIIRSLTNAGRKLYSKDASGLQLYNLDLSPFLTIDFPAAPEGSTYFGPVYFLESTFDTDPSSIEVMMLMQDAEFNLWTRVIRDDGTVVFEDLQYGISAQGGHEDLNGGPPLFNGDDGTAYMILSNYPYAVPTVSKLYQLPGTVPCLDCSNSGLGIEPVDLGAAGSKLELMPNPASDMVTIHYALPQGTRSGTLLVYDASGRQVQAITVSGSGTTQLSMTSHAAGSYRCSLMAGQPLLKTRSLIVTR